MADERRERVRFHFDPACPWCWQTSRWIRRLAELGVVEVSWGIFSLALVNAGQEDERMAASHARSSTALRTAILTGDEYGAGSDGVGAFYAALGRRTFDRAEPLEDVTTVAGALEDAGLEPALAARALENPATWDRVVAAHGDLVERTHAFGVPTIVLDDGEGPTIFGPVVYEPPGDADAVDLLRHVVWLVRYENFAELKRHRDRAPDLESVRRRAAG